MRISDWSSDVCSSDLQPDPIVPTRLNAPIAASMPAAMTEVIPKSPQIAIRWVCTSPLVVAPQMKKVPKRIQKVSDRETPLSTSSGDTSIAANEPGRSEEHTSELQSLMRISYAVFCLKKKKK